MSVNVSYANRIGYCTLKQGENKFKIWFCHMNGLCAMMYFYNEVEDGKKIPMVHLHAFFSDLTHAKRCINNDFFADYSNFHFYAKELNNDLWRMIRVMTEKNIKVTIE